jgi:hypothetical protein
MGNRTRENEKRRSGRRRK